MKALQALLALLFLPATLFAIDEIPAGTTLPVVLGRTLDASKLRAGDVIVVKLAQNVPLGASNRLRSGTRISGRVVESKVAAGKDQGSSITLTFDRVLGPEPFAIVTDLRAIASPLEVDGTRTPASGPDRGTSSAVYTTVLVGGDVVYRGGGPVMRDGLVVGQPVYDGVLVQLAANPEGNCRGEIGDPPLLQATSVFGSAACGAYGFSDLTITHSGRSAPQGEIVLRSERRPIKLRAGTALLLRVMAPPGTNGGLAQP
jgi:hypothetical protein